MLCFICCDSSNLDDNNSIYDIQNNNYSFHSLFSHTCVCCAFVFQNCFLIYSSFQNYWNDEIYQIIDFDWVDARKIYCSLTKNDYDRHHHACDLSIISCIITLNNIISLILSTSFIIKSLFFNIKISLVKNSITLWYLSNEDSFFLFLLNKS